jgi:outer membrane protein, heavy metal efflux system
MNPRAAAHALRRRVTVPLSWTRLSRVAFVLAAVILPRPAQAQEPARPITAGPAAVAAQSSLDSLVAIALEANPRIHAAHAQIEAARARISPAGTLPDPMLGVGIMNLPIAEPGFDDFMTMKTIAVGQQVPFPGKLTLARRAAEHGLRAAEARLEVVRRDVGADVRIAYYETAFLDHAANVVEASQRLVVDAVQSAESRYAVGTADQSDVLRARVEASKLAEEAVTLAESRRAAVARLNALLSRPSDTPLATARIPDRIARAAVSGDAARIRFTSAALGARAADSPLPALAELQALAVRSSPELRAHEAEIAAQAARLELAGRAHYPDFDISLQYGQRADRTDMASVMVSVPLPIHRRARQEEGIAEARAELAEMEAGHHAMLDRLNAEVAEHYAALERERARLALFVASILPQGRAAVESATISFRVGRADFTTLLDTERTLYDYEITMHRALADFAKTLAELERTVGADVLP